MAYQTSQIANFHKYQVAGKNRSSANPRTTKQQGSDAMMITQKVGAGKTAMVFGELTNGAQSS